MNKYNDGRDNPKPNKVIGVFGLAHHTKRGDLEQVFGQKGEIDHIDLIVDRMTGECRGFGFVYFVKQRGADRAREECNGMILQGRKVRVDYSITNQKH